MELGLGLLGAVLLLFGVAARIAVIHTGPIIGLFKAANEDPIFTIAVLVGLVSVVVGLLTGTPSAGGSFKLFENGVGWALTHLRDYYDNRVHCWLDGHADKGFPGKCRQARGR